MAFRSQTHVVALVAVVAGTLMAQELHVPVELQRAGRNELGELRFDGDGAHFVPVTQPKFAFDVTWQDIQQLSVSARAVRIRTYEDQRWKLGRDRELQLSRREGTFRAGDVLLLRRWLPSKLSTGLAVPGADLWWSVPAKWNRGLGGSVGTLSVWSDRVTFASDKGGRDATWFDRDLIQVVKSGRFGLMLTTAEPSRFFHAGERTVSFQTQEEVDDRRVDALWRRLQRAANLGFIADQQELDHRDKKGK